MTKYTKESMGHVQDAVTRINQRRGSYRTFVEEIALEMDKVIAQVRDECPDPSESHLTFEEVTAVNHQRAQRWHADSKGWTSADWSNAMAGEVGEACNVVKKLRRHETNSLNPGDPSVSELTDQLATELADAFIYMDLLARHYWIDLPAAIIDKFNSVSRDMGWDDLQITRFEEDDE